MTDIIKALDNKTNKVLIGYLEYVKEWGENMFYDLDGEIYFEHEITIIDNNHDCRFPTTE